MVRTDYDDTVPDTAPTHPTNLVAYTSQCNDASKSSSDSPRSQSTDDTYTDQSSFFSLEDDGVSHQELTLLREDESEKTMLQAEQTLQQDQESSSFLSSEGKSTPSFLTRLWTRLWAFVFSIFQSPSPTPTPTPPALAENIAEKDVVQVRRKDPIENLRKEFDIYLKEFEEFFQQQLDKKLASQPKPPSLAENIAEKDVVHVHRKNPIDIYLEECAEFQRRLDKELEEDYQRHVQELEQREENKRLEEERDRQEFEETMAWLREHRASKNRRRRWREPGYSDKFLIDHYKDLAWRGSLTEYGQYWTPETETECAEYGVDVRGVHALLMLEIPEYVELIE